MSWKAFPSRMTSNSWNCSCVCVLHLLSFYKFSFPEKTALLMSNFSSPAADRSSPSTPLSAQRMSSSKRKSLSTAIATENAQSIKVICRFRPVKQIEIDRYGQSESMNSSNFIIDEERGTVETNVDYDKKSFTFDRVSNVSLFSVSR